jgi:hypothetical protein
MLFNKKLGPDEYEIVKEGNEEVIRINSINTNYLPSLEDSALCMSRTIEKLIQVPSASRIIFSERRNYEYDYEQTRILLEIATLYNYLVRQRRIISYIAAGPSQECISCYPKGYEELRYIVYNLFKSDPIGAYITVKRMIRQERIAIVKRMKG